MNAKKGDEIQLKIVDLSFGGAGVGKYKMPDGGEIVVFVERVVPGDEIMAGLTKIKKQYFEAKLIEIIKESPERIAPRCKHFGVCGGCSLQFMDYKNQLKWKEKIVRDSLERIGEIKNPPISPIIGVESPWFYRNKMEYSFGSAVCGIGDGERGAADKSLKLGLHPAKNYKDVFDLEDCFLESEISAQIAVAVRKWAILRKIPAYDPRINAGILRNLTVREGKNTGEIMVILFTNEQDFPHEKDFSKLISEKFPAVTSVYRTAVMIKKGHKTVVEEFHLAGKKTLTETLTVLAPSGTSKSGAPLTLKFEILPQAFFQPNTRGAQILYETALNFANPQKSETVLDLFCGTGTIGLFAASRAKKVLGIELNASAVLSAKKNAEQNGITNTEFICADVGKYLASAPFSVPRSSPLLITDPPRSGIFPKTLQKILELRPAKWIYVSCNPTTLARDLKEIVKTGYKLQKVQPVDMFPHTYHVETVCELLL